MSFRFPDLSRLWGMSVPGERVEPGLKALVLECINKFFVCVIPDLRDYRTHRISLSRVCNCRLHHLLKRQSSKLFRELCPGRRSAWDHHRNPATLRHRGVSLLFYLLCRDCHGCSSTGIEAVKLPFRPDQGKGIASDPVGGRLQHGHTGRCGDRRVNGISSLFYDIKPRLCRQRLARADHAFPAVYHASSRWIVVFQRVKFQHSFLLQVYYFLQTGHRLFQLRGL